MYSGALSQGCDPLLLRIESGPAGMSWAGGILSWKPVPADTGYHEIRMAGTGSCQEKVFLVAGVAARPQVTIRSKGQATARRLAELAWNTPGEFDLVLSHPSVVELRTLTGRLLYDFGRLSAGEHALLMPSDSRSEGLLLCRVRSDAGEARLKVTRFR